MGKTTDWTPDELTVSELAYTAGIVDGEGSIGIRKRRNNRGVVYHVVTLEVSNTDPALIVWLHKRYGGTVNQHRQQMANSKVLFRWIVSAVKAGSILQVLLPYLVIKKAQAEVAILMRQAICPLGTNRITQDMRDKREALYRRMRHLNKRGVGQPVELVA